MFSESPPLKRKNSDQNPPKTEATSACAEALNEELLHFMAGGFIPLDEFRENNRICKAKLNQIRLKHRSEEIRNVNSRKVDWFGNIRMCLLFENSIVCQVC